MAELADALDLGSSAARHESSSLSPRIMFLNSNASKGYGKKDFLHAIRFGKGNIKGKVALPLKERSDGMGVSSAKTLADRQLPPRNYPEPFSGKIAWRGTIICCLLFSSQLCSITQEIRNVDMLEESVDKPFIKET